MMAAILERIVASCLRWSKLVVAAVLLLAALGVWYSAKHFTINTDTTGLISPNIPWRQDQIAYQKDFPHLIQNIVAVIDGPSAEAVEDAADRLVAGLEGKPLIQRVWRPDSNDYLRREGLLLLPLDDFKKRLGDIGARADFLNGLASDPTIRGLMNVLARAMEQAGQQGRQEEFGTFVEPLGKMATTIEDALAGKPARLSWQSLFGEGSNPIGETRRIVLIYPKLDFAALEPGRKPIEEVRNAARQGGITGDNGLRLRLTGLVPLADEEFATVAENYEINTAATVLAVALILWLALRSGKLIGAVLATLFVGLAITAGVGLAMIGQLNLISVAFAVLFIGLGVDFGIQFATRYREERFKLGDTAEALRATARQLGVSLTLAAVSLVAGFFCFLPTEFYGVSELGLIAGVGMIIAFAATVTFLPALIALIKPAPERAPVATASLAFIDHWIENHRGLVLALTALVTLAGMPALFRLQFDSNPMNLRSAKVESVSTFLDLAKNPRTAPNTISVLEPDLAAADATARRLAALPEVAEVVSLATFIPQDQTAKLASMGDTRAKLGPAMNPRPAPPPDEAATTKSLNLVASMLQIAEDQDAPEPVLHFKRAVEALRDATPEKRQAAQNALFANFGPLLDRLRLALGAKGVGEADVPPDLRADWVSANGRYRVQATAKGDSNDNAVLDRFANAVRRVAPHATGAPIAVLEAGRTIVRSFLEAGLFAFVAIFAILYFAMRSVKDVALALGPLVLAGVMSLQAAQLMGMSLDFANIIALPLMFGVGVAFHIYYLIAWRKGERDMLASSLTRAIFFSSLTTGTAFGSLMLSSHPGTAGMGKLLAISLFFTLLAAFIIVPAFLGPPPQSGESAG